MTDEDRIERIAEQYHDLKPEGVSWADAGSRYRTQMRKTVKLVLLAQAYVERHMGDRK